jgi:ribosomal protein S18 acetylase RimI-like enzyme
MRVRPLDAADVAALAPELARLPLMRRYGRSAAEVANDLAAALVRDDGLLVAEENARICGLAWFLPQGTLALGGYLRLIAVVAGHERAGTGSALLDAFERAVGVQSRHAFLLVSDFNCDAQRFYERHGYRRVGALPGLVLSDVDELLYWKRLA